MAQPINIVVYVSGGNITGISTDLANPDGVRVAIVDYDNGHDVAPEDMTFWGVHQLDDGLASVGMQCVASDPNAVAAIMEKADA